MSQSPNPSRESLISAVHWIMSLPEDAFTGYVPPNERRPHKPASKRGDKVDAAP